MPRHPRVKSEYSTYHIVQRGNDRKNIFLSEEDKVRFLKTLQQMSDKYNFRVEAYCLMDNHIHMLINDNGNDISKIVKSLNVSYAYYFNRTYKRVGHLFQDRFRSDIISDDNYLLQVSAYIHNNPVKAGIAKTPEDYKWSSFTCYLGQEGDKLGLVETDRILSMFSTVRKKAIQQYYDYVIKFKLDKKIIDVEDDVILYKTDNPDYIDTYEKAEELVIGILEEKGIKIEELKKEKDIRNNIIKKLRNNSSLQLSEIGRLMGGISQSTVCKILVKGG